MVFRRFLSNVFIGPSKVSVAQCEDFETRSRRFATIGRSGVLYTQQLLDDRPHV